MQTRKTASGAVRDRIDAADQAIMARLSAESSPMLDRFLPALSRSADFFALWIAIAAALAASKDERGRRAALRGLAGMVTASTASNVLAKGLVRRPRPAGEVPRDLVSVRARRRCGGVRHRRRAGNTRPGGASRGARGSRGYIPRRERRALPVRHRRGMGSRRRRRAADAAVVAAAPVSARGRASRLTPPFRQDAAATVTQWAAGS